MNCISWNCQGLGAPRAIRDLKTLIRSHQPKLLFLMETRLPHRQLSFLKHQLGFTRGVMVERTGLGGGLILLWHEFDVHHLNFSHGHIDTWISNWLPTGSCYYRGFYGHWQASQRCHSWALLRRIGTHRTLTWCVIGDFNELMYSHETSSSRGRVASEFQPFRQTVSDLDLTEIHMNEARFTWSNKCKGAALVRSKLDRGFGNGAFILAQPRCAITVVPMVTLDHHALFLSLRPDKSETNTMHRRPIRMEPWWLLRQDCRDLIKDVWW